jgi:uncharacterized protein (TIGR00251 family)
LTIVELQPTVGGIILPVQAQPGARKNGVTGVHAGRLKVAVTQAPEKGKANKALIDVLAEALGVKRKAIRLLSGETSSHKKFLVAGVDLPALQRRITALVGS